MGVACRSHGDLVLLRRKGEASMRVRRGLVAGGDKEGDNKTGGPHLPALTSLDMLDTILCILGE